MASVSIGGLAASSRTASANLSTLRWIHYIAIAAPPIVQRRNLIRSGDDQNFHLLNLMTKARFTIRFLPILSQFVLFKILSVCSVQNISLIGDTTYQILSQNSYFCVMLLKTWKTLYSLAEMKCQITIVICVLKRKQKC